MVNDLLEPLMMTYPSGKAVLLDEWNTFALNDVIVGLALATPVKSMDQSLPSAHFGGWGVTVAVGGLAPYRKVGELPLVIDMLYPVASWNVPITYSRVLTPGVGTRSCPAPTLNVPV